MIGNGTMLFQNSCGSFGSMLDEFSTMGAINLSVPSRLCQQDEDALRIGAESAALVTQSTTNKNKKSGDKAKQAQQRIAAEELLQNQIACKKQEVDILKERLDAYIYT